jgi:hypothetical protein
MTSQKAKKLYGNTMHYLTWFWDSSVKLAGKLLFACLVLAIGLPASCLAAAAVLVIFVPVTIYYSFRVVIQMFKAPPKIEPVDAKTELFNALKPIVTGLTLGIPRGK